MAGASQAATDKNHETAVTGLHPGWQTLVGRDPVIDSWRRFLPN
jgi:hypothetical protein